MIKPKHYKKMKQIQVFHILTLILIATSSTEAIDYAKKGCKDTCGSVRIPYPFGIGVDCAANKWYVVDCNSSKPYLSAFNNMEVLDVNMEEQTVIVNVSVISRCQTTSVDRIPSIDLGESPFVFSGKHNNFNIDGCGYAGILDDKEVVRAAAAITCDDTTNEIAVCSAHDEYLNVPNLKSYSVDVSALNGTNGDGSCGSAFLGIKPMVFDTIWRSGCLTRSPSYYPIALLWFLTKDDVHQLPNCWEPYQLEMSDGSSIHLRKCSCGIGRVGNQYLPNQCEGITFCFITIFVL